MRPGELRTAEKGVDAASKLGQGAGHVSGGQARKRAADEVTEELETGGAGGELKSGRRRLIQRMTIHRSSSRSRSRKAMRDAKSEEVTIVLGERGLVRSPYRSCMATFKGWTLVRTDGRPRVKQGNASRKLGGRGEGEPPRSRNGGGKSRGKGKQSRGRRRVEREGIA